VKTLCNAVDWADITGFYVNVIMGYLLIYCWQRKRIGDLLMLCCQRIPLVALTCKE